MKPQSNKLRRYGTIYTALHLLKDVGGQMRWADIKERIQEIYPQTNYEIELSKSGYPRWENWLSFLSAGAVKAGFIVKEKGVWHLTEEGEQALALSLEDYIVAQDKRYKKWYDANKKTAPELTEEEQEEVIENTFDLEAIKAQATEGIREYINTKNPYEFQQLVAALFRALGYYTPFIAPKGKDGGIDIIAYNDPLGTTLPRVKVQVKHYPTTAISVDVVRSLLGVLARSGEVGVVVTSGTFTSEARREARSSHTPVSLIDIDEFIDLWTRHYHKMSEEDKSYLSIIPVHFINPSNV